MRAGERSQGKRRGPARDALIHYYFTGETLSIPKTAQIAFDCVKPTIDKAKYFQKNYASKFKPKTKNKNNGAEIPLKFHCNFSEITTPIVKSKGQEQDTHPVGVGKKKDFEISKSAPPPPPPGFT